MGCKLNSNPIHHILLPTSLIYLSLPMLIFVIGWLKWYFAIPVAGLVLLTVTVMMRGLVQGQDSEQYRENPPKIGWKHLVLVCLASLIFLSFSGIGGIGYQDTDWLKHNTILKELVVRPWPVQLRVAGQDFALVYYLAYYLPAALLGKLGGWALANLFLFIWSLAGLILAMLWFLALSNGAKYALIGLCVFFSGLDIVGEVLTQIAVPILRPEYQEVLQWGHIEQWSIGWQYSSNTTLLFWVPQQALAGWIASGVLLYAIFYPTKKSYSLLVAGLTPLWSVFVTIGLLPYLLAEFYLRRGGRINRLKSTLTVPNLCGLVLAALTGLYYSAKFPAGPQLDQKIPSGFVLSFLPDSQARVISSVLLLIFMVLEFGLFSLAIWSGRKAWDTPSKVVFITTFFCLVLIPWYRVGGINDFVMRTSIPALFVLAIFVGRTLHPRSTRRWIHIFLIVLLVIGSVTALIEFRRHILGMATDGKIVNMPEMREVQYLSAWGVSTDKDETIVLQYVGSPKAVFFKWLARRP